MTANGCPLADARRRTRPFAAAALLVIAAVLFLPLPLCAQDTLVWQQLMREADAAYRQGRYSEAESGQNERSTSTRTTVEKPEVARA